MATVNDKQSTASEERPFAVALVNMPFASVHRPSLQVGLLKSIAVSRGVSAETYHLNLDFAAEIGVPLYNVISEHRLPIGDWLFAKAAFGKSVPAAEEFVDANAQEVEALLAQGGWHLNRLLQIREHVVPEYLSNLLDGIDWHQFEVIGFTSTFQQNVPSLALAGLLKERWPETTLVFGGANLDGDMGLEFVRSMPCIDYAISGEADRAFPEFLKSMRGATDPCSIPGVVSRRGELSVMCPTEPPFDHLDELPIPDYDEYFERSSALGLAKAESGRRSVSLPFESSRGCWWGAKRHCTFCGLNSSTMAFRRKSAERVQNELSTLARRYHTYHFSAVDNILDPQYFDDLFPEIIASGSSYRLFYEVKADLSRHELETLHKAGVRWVQPGIESLSSKVLGLMRKGTRASTNVNFLRWALFYGIHTMWNILWGFPREAEEDYDGQPTLVRNLVHLQPPVSAGRIWMERFSPIYFDRGAFPAERVEPASAYRHIYPESVDLDRAAYFFEYRLEDTLPDEFFKEITSAVEEWRHRWSNGRPRPSLSLWSAPGLVHIEDSRDGTSRTHLIEGDAASIYMACSDKAASPAAVREALQLRREPEEVRKQLEELCERGIMMRDGNLFLALGVPTHSWLK